MQETTIDMMENISIRHPETVKRPLIKQFLEVLAHTHSKLPGTKEEFYKYWQDGQFLTTTLTRFAKNLGARTNGFYIIDSDHAAHSLKPWRADLYTDSSEARRLRVELFSREQRQKTIEQISHNLDKRRQAIETMRADPHNPDFLNRIFTGAEVDILGSDGQLDVQTETLLKMDCIGISLHKDEWKDASGSEATLEQVHQAYMAATKNPGVDVINHLIRELPESEWQKLKQHPEYFDDLFKLIADTNKALEINLRDLVDPKRKAQNEVLFQLIGRAKKIGVKFMMGTDFHRLEQYMQTELPAKDSTDGQPHRQTAIDGRDKLTQLGENGPYFKDQSEVEAYEQEVVKVLEQIFPAPPILKNKEGLMSKGVSINLLKVARPVYYALKRLTKEDIGLVPDDLINGDIKRFSKWIESRREAKKISQVAQRLEQK